MVLAELNFDSESSRKYGVGPTVIVKNVKNVIEPC